MTEAEWLACDDWGDMYDHVCGRATTRQFLLLAVALCRQIWDRFPFDECRQIVEAVERLADHPRVSDGDYDILDEVNATTAALQERYHRIHETEERPRGACLAAMACGGVWHDPGEMIMKVADSAVIAVVGRTTGRAWHDQVRTQNWALHELFGNPFRPVAFAPNWRTETAVVLASGIYAERAFDRLPILADALEEAGCEHADVLTHCRGLGPHVRGCWVVDGVLGKT